MKKLYYRLFKRYRRLDLVFVSYEEGNKLIRGNAGKLDGEQWRIAKEEDRNGAYNRVYLERRERILS